MSIDGHAHAAKDFADIKTLLKVLDQNLIDMVILCPSLKNKTDLSSPPKIFMSKGERDINKMYSANKFIRLTYRFLSKNGDPNEFVGNLKKMAPDRIIQFYWIDFDDDNLLNNLHQSIEKYDYLGLKIHQAWTPFSFNTEIFKGVLRFAEKYSLPIFIHPRTIKETRLLKQIALKYPKNSFIIAHLMGAIVFADFSGDNVFHDVSPHDLSTAEIYNSLKNFSSKKLVFGSDTPFGQLGINLKKIRRLKISEEEKNNILGENLKALLKL